MVLFYFHRTNPFVSISRGTPRIANCNRLNKMRAACESEFFFLPPLSLSFSLPLPLFPHHNLSCTFSFFFFFFVRFQHIQHRVHSRNNCCIASFGKRLREKAKFEGFPIKRHEYSKNIKMLFYVLLPRWTSARACHRSALIEINRALL